MWIFRWIIMAVLIILIIGFAMQNMHQQVVVQFVNYETIPLPLWLVMYLSFAVGLFVWLLVSIVQILTYKNLQRKQRKEIKSLKTELDRLRNVSIEDSIVPDPKLKSITTSQVPPKE